MCRRLVLVLVVKMVLTCLYEHAANDIIGVKDIGYCCAVSRVVDTVRRRPGPGPLTMTDDDARGLYIDGGVQLHLAPWDDVRSRPRGLAASLCQDAAFLNHISRTDRDE